METYAAVSVACVTVWKQHNFSESKGLGKRYSAVAVVTLLGPHPHKSKIISLADREPRILFASFLKRFNFHRLWTFLERLSFQNYLSFQ